MPKVKEFLRPDSLQQALELLAKHGDKTRILAGGTTVALAGSGTWESVLSLEKLGLNTIERGEDGVHIGAMATMDQVRRFMLSRNQNALLDASVKVGTRVLQNHVTVGGNCVMVYAWSDFPVVMLCLEARFFIQGLEGVRKMDAETFYSQHPTRHFKKGELLTHVAVGPCQEGRRSAFVKLSRDETDHAIASVCSRIQIADGRIAEARIVVGGVSGMPQYMHEASEALVGLAPDEGAFLDAGRRVAEEAKTVDDIRGSAEYRRAILPAVVRDALSKAAQRAGGAS